MTTAFQTVIDYSQAISINKKKKVAQSTSRDGTVKTTSLGGQIWEFEVSLPNGPKWSDFRGLIEKMEALDRVTVGTIQINLAGQSWLNGYQGNLSNVTAITVTATSGNTLTITGGTSGLSVGQFKFKAGDFIQLGAGGKVYTVAADVAYNSNTITLHRPLRDAAGTYTLLVGQAVTWSVICVKFPNWNIFARDQVAWDGPFVFAESL
jgi:hypothetical protein